MSLVGATLVMLGGHPCPGHDQGLVAFACKKSMIASATQSGHHALSSRHTIKGISNASLKPYDAAAATSAGLLLMIAMNNSMVHTTLHFKLKTNTILQPPARYIRASLTCCMLKPAATPRTWPQVWQLARLSLLQCYSTATSAVTCTWQMHKDQ